jgi:hypothetical protein
MREEVEWRKTRERERKRKKTINKRQRDREREGEKNVEAAVKGRGKTGRERVVLPCKMASAVRVSLPSSRAKGRNLPTKVQAKTTDYLS